MSIIEHQNIPSPGEMWQFVSKILDYMGMIIDKASLDDAQLFRLYLEFRKLDNTFRDSIQIHILKNELAYSLLENLVN